MLLKYCTQYASKFWKLSSCHRTGKGQFSFQSQRKVMPKNVQTTTQSYSSHTSKVMLKILQTRLLRYVSHEFPDVQAGFRKGRGTSDQISNICWIIEKAREFPQKNLFLLYWRCQSLWLWITTNCGKLFKRWEYQTTWPASWEIYMQVKKLQLELDMEQQTGSRERSMSRLYIVTLLI